MKRILLQLLIFLSAAELGLAQQPPGSCPGNMAPLAPFCSQACVLCDIDGYVGMNVNQSQWEAPPQFCAPQFHSIQWIGFVAGSASISFSITTLMCDDGNGLQAGIYRTVDCTSWVSVSNCDPGFTSTVLNASGLVPGNTYFFVIDGNAGDECEFQIDVLSGSATAPPVVGTPVIAGPANLCTGGTGTYVANGVTGAASYTWTLNGNVVGYDQQVLLPNLPTGTHTLCVQPANPCFGIGNSSCRTITVGPLPLETLNRTLCFEDLPFTYQGFSFSSPGTHNFSYNRADGCEQPVRLTLNVINPIPDTEISADICFGQEAYFFGNRNYTQTGYYSHTFTTAQGCDSTVNLSLIAHRPSFTQLGYIDHCQLLGPYYIGNMVINTSGDFSFTLPDQYGCDSIVAGYLNLTTPDVLYLDTVICQGEYVELGDYFYSNTGAYSEEYTEPGGCQSSFNLNLLVYDPETTIDTVICPGETVTVGTTTYSASGSYTRVLPARYLNLGCDSTVHLNLTVRTPIVNNIQASICEGESYLLGSTSYSSAGTYTQVFDAANGCDSTVRLTLTVYPDVETAINTDICFGDTYTVGDSVFAQSGAYQVLLQSYRGCDSTVFLNLNVKDAILTTLNEEVCDGSTFTAGGMDFGLEGTYEIALTAADGCDSTVFLNLDVLSQPETTLDEDICLGQSYQVGSSSYNATGTYTDVLLAANGCDSTVTLNLNVIEPIVNNITRRICTGQSYTVGSSTYSQAGNYVDTLANFIGCDSIVLLTLTIEDVIRDTLAASICEGESFTVAGTAYSTTGFYDNDFITASGCDSIFYLDLTVVPIRYTSLDRTICDGESVSVGTSTYDATGAYQDVLTSAETGCDSVVSLSLQVLNVPRTPLVENICDGETYTVGSSDYSTTGIFIDTLAAANGCDSIVTLNLTVLDVPETMLVEDICDGETYTVGSSDYTTTGIYQDVLVAANGCDSIVSLDLTVKDVPETFLTREICQYETFSVGTSDYTASGSYTDVLTAANGCDSIVYLDLTVFPERTRALDVSICLGSSYTVGTSTYNQAGTYVDTLASAITGCDSIVTLNLQVTDFYEINLVETICEFQSFTVGADAYTQSGQYTNMFISSDGCDSIVNLDLAVIPLPRTTIDATICEGEAVTVGGLDYMMSGVYQDTLASLSSGCDSVITLNLTVNEVYETDLIEEICDGQAYQVGTSAYTQSGIFQDMLTATNGCDSMVTLDLTVHPIPETNLVETICFGDSYPVGASSYNTSGQYQDIIPSVVTGCDSIVNLNLTVREEIRTGLEREICDGEVFTVGSSAYSTSGIHIDTLASAATGCDSIITLDLTVHPIPVTNLVQEICDGEVFEVGNSDYTASGGYQDVLSSVVTGCDSIVNLDLTVHPIPVTNLVQEICDGEVFEVGNSGYTTSGGYQDVLSSVLTGCDSIVNLDLTVHPIPVTNLVQEICDGEAYQVGTSSYTTSGIYQDVLVSARTGCDSIVNLDLSINQVYDVVLFEDICEGSSFPIGDTDYALPGSYTQVLVSREGCDSVVTLNLSVYPCMLVYDRAITNVSCHGLSDGDFSFQLTVGTPPYQYTWQSANGTGQSGAGTLDGNGLEAVIEGLPAGTYRIDVVDSSPFSVEASFTVSISQPSPLDIGMEMSDYNNYNTSCHDESDGHVDATVSGGTPPYSYIWNTGVRSEDIDGLPAGSYGLTVTDQNLCPDSARTTLLAPAPVEARLAITDPPCFGDESGIIRVNEVTGGVSPYLYGLDGRPLSTVPQFANLPIGEHLVQVQDANGCMWEEEEVVNQPDQLVVELGTDIEIKLGDSVQLFARTTYPVAFFNWSSPVDINCENCQAPFVRPFESAAFAVTVIDSSGCRATDRLTIFVDRKRDVFIPNVFSPNNDGQNDRFLIFADDEAVRVKSFYVFNRWGEPMFELFGFPPNNPTYGWDGTHRGELMNGGVYVYTAEIEFVDGVTELFKGDVLLMR